LLFSQIVNSRFRKNRIIQVNGIREIFILTNKVLLVIQIEEIMIQMKQYNR